MRAFKKGDRVRVKKDQGTYLFRAGDEFIIAGGGTHMVDLEPNDIVTQSTIGWFAHRFELVSEVGPLSDVSTKDLADELARRQREGTVLIEIPEGWGLVLNSDLKRDVHEVFIPGRSTTWGSEFLERLAQLTHVGDPAPFMVVARIKEDAQ